MRQLSIFLAVIVIYMFSNYMLVEVSVRVSCSLLNRILKSIVFHSLKLEFSLEVTFRLEFLSVVIPGVEIRSIMESKSHIERGYPRYDESNSESVLFWVEDRKIYH